MTIKQPNQAIETLPTGRNSYRRWFQISIRTLLLVIAFVSILFAILVGRATRQRRAVMSLQAIGAKVGYDFDKTEAEVAAIPDWLRTALGDDYFQTVHGLDLGDLPITDAGKSGISPNCTNSISSG